jgi:hypothetical protein
MLAEDAHVSAAMNFGAEMRFIIKNSIGFFLNGSTPIDETKED